MPWDPVTFGLAWLGYALLATDFAMRARGAGDRRVSAATAVVAVAHVACVYAFRFGGSLSEAWQKSVPGFLLFHTALGVIVAGAIAPEPWRTRCVRLAFAVVSLGGLGAPFRYPELGVLAAPLLGVFAVAVTVAVRGRRSRPQ